MRVKTTFLRHDRVHPTFDGYQSDVGIRSWVESWISSINAWSRWNFVIAIFSMLNIFFFILLLLLVMMMFLMMVGSLMMFLTWWVGRALMIARDKLNWWSDNYLVWPLFFCDAFYLVVNWGDWILNFLKFSFKTIFLELCMFNKFFLEQKLRKILIQIASKYM